MKKAAVIIVTVLLTIIVTFAVVIYGYLNSFSHKAGQNNDSTIKPKETESGKPFNVLLLGVDIGTAGSKDSPKRSDTMLIFHFEPSTSEISMVSIPRDTMVTIKGSAEKINAANAFGGTELAISSVEKLLDVDINYYVEIDYQGFREIVDAVGGIDVVIPYNMNYDDELQNLHIHFKKGQQVHLDGKKAEQFVRWRKNNDGTGYAEGDLGRIKTQQEFIQKVIEKFKSATLAQKKSVIDILPQYVNTNMGAGTMLSLAITELPKVDIDSIQKFTLQGDAKTVDSIWYFVYNPNRNGDIIALLGGKAPEQNNDINKKDIKVQVLNGSGTESALENVKKTLVASGYTVVAAGSITGADFTSSHIIDKSLKTNYAKQVGEDLDISLIQKDQDTLSSADIVVVLGKDMNNK